MSNLGMFGTKAEVLKPKSCRRNTIESKTWTGHHVEYSPGDTYHCCIPEFKGVFMSKDIELIDNLIARNETIASGIKAVNLSIIIKSTTEMIGFIMKISNRVHMFLMKNQLFNPRNEYFG